MMARRILSSLLMWLGDRLFDVGLAIDQVAYRLDPHKPVWREDLDRVLAQFDAGETPLARYRANEGR